MTFNICLLTFSIYIGSAIYTSGLRDITREFAVSQTVAVLGLTLYVLGYGMGPMIFVSPIKSSWSCCLLMIDLPIGTAI